MISLSRPLLWYALTPWLAVMLLREAQRRMGKGKLGRSTTPTLPVQKERSVEPLEQPSIRNPRSK
jgi:hypothetical protein